jgi:transcriptional regulator with XRE-family HTH domain
MRPLVISSPGAIQRQIARRVVASRLALGWTREVLAERSGIAVDTLKRFEQTGQVSLERLLKIAVALDALREFSGLFPEPAAASLDELETRAAARRRIRVRGRRAQPMTSQRNDAPTTGDDAAP